MTTLENSDNPLDIDPETYQQTLEAIKKILAIKGEKMSDERLKNIVSNKIYMDLGIPVQIRPIPKNRNQDKSYTQYDRNIDRFKLQYHKFIRNPKSSVIGISKISINSLKLKERITFFFEGLSPKTSPAKVVTEVLSRLHRYGYKASRRTVFDVIKKLQNKK